MVKRITYLTSILITNILIYFFCAFVTWDMAWLSDIAEWHAYDRFFFLLFVGCASAMGVLVEALRLGGEGCR